MISQRNYSKVIKLSFVLPGLHLNILKTVAIWGGENSRRAWPMSIPTQEVKDERQTSSLNGSSIPRVQRVCGTKNILGKHRSGGRDLGFVLQVFGLDRAGLHSIRFDRASQRLAKKKRERKEKKRNERKKFAFQSQWELHRKRGGLARDSVDSVEYERGSPACVGIK